MADDDAAEEPVVHGQLSYLEVPARDVGESARFYTELFGWSFVPGYPGSFDAPGGLIGSLQSAYAPAAERGPRLWLFVADIAETLRRAPEVGGRVVEGVSSDGPRLLATVADPSGNHLGVWQLAPG